MAGYKSYNASTLRWVLKGIFSSVVANKLILIIRYTNV